MWQSGPFSSLSLCFQNNILLALHLVHLPSWYRFELLPLLVDCCLRIRNFSSLEASEEFCVQNSNDLSTCIQYLRCDLHDLLVEWIPNAFSWIHELPWCNACFVFLNFVLDSSLSLTFSRSFFKHFFVHILQGIAASIRISNFFLAFLMASFSVSASSGSMK